MNMNRRGLLRRVLGLAVSRLAPRGSLARAATGSIVRTGRPTLIEFSTDGLEWDSTLEVDVEATILNGGQEPPYEPRLAWPYISRTLGGRYHRAEFRTEDIPDTPHDPGHKQVTAEFLAAQIEREECRLLAMDEESLWEEEQEAAEEAERIAAEMEGAALAMDEESLREEEQEAAFARYEESLWEEDIDPDEA